MKTLVLGDIHHRLERADSFIQKYAASCEQVVFLGDYFDSPHDTPQEMRDTCEWLASSIRNPNRFHLLGNHDVPYFLPTHESAKCPGWSQAKQEVFNEVVASLPLDSFFLALQLGPWLLSHAGFAERHAKGGDSGTLAQAANGELAAVQEGANSWIFDIGEVRGGKASLGGLLWLDWPREFRPVPGLNQLVGHSPALGVARGKWLTGAGEHRSYEFMEPTRYPRMEMLPQPCDDLPSVNWCLDTALIVAAVIDNGKLELVT